MSLVLLGIAFKEEVSANPAPDPNPRHHRKAYRGRSYYGGYRFYRPSPYLSYGYGYGKRSADPEPNAGPNHRYGHGMIYRGKGYGGYYGYYGK